MCCGLAVCFVGIAHHCNVQNVRTIHTTNKWTSNPDERTHHAQINQNKVTMLLLRCIILTRYKYIVRDGFVFVWYLNSRLPQLDDIEFQCDLLRCQQRHSVIYPANMVATVSLVMLMFAFVHFLLSIYIRCFVALVGMVSFCIRQECTIWWQQTSRSCNCSRKGFIRMLSYEHCVCVCGMNPFGGISEHIHARC